MANWIEENVEALEKLYAALETEIKEFKQNMGIDCLAGCAQCCQYPEIEATVLEFLPLALDLYRKNEINDFMDRDFSGLCVLFRAHREIRVWGCSDYTNRGMICRLFGFSATLAKDRTPVLATCTQIKEKWPEYKEKVKNVSKVPILRDWYNALTDINPRLGECFYPINDAIKRAIELVSFTLKYSKK